MAAIPFILLFVVGLLLSIIFGITNIVLAFQESIGWGFLVLLLPFAALAFSIKFWHRKWVRRSFLYNVGGVVAAFLSAIGMSLTLPALLQQADRARLAQQDAFYAETWEETAFEPDSQTAIVPTTAEAPEPFYAGVSSAMAAAELTQTAQSSADWTEVADNWERAIAMMASVPAEHPQFEVAQTKVSEYEKNLAYAAQNSQR